MADKVEKPKKSKPKPKKDETGVLAALPSTRSERIGARRASAGAARKPVANGTAATRPPAKATPAKTSPAKRSAAKTTAAKRSPAKATGEQTAATRATATRRKPAAPRTFEPTPAAESAAAPPPREPEPRPRAVREGAPGMGTTGERGEQPSPEHGRPSGVELVSTAVQAAGELAQVGLAIGGRILKRAVDRLPKP